jgi:hypothetical protein
MLPDYVMTYLQLKLLRGKNTGLFVFMTFSSVDANTWTIKTRSDSYKESRSNEDANTWNATLNSTDFL